HTTVSSLRSSMVLSLPTHSRRVMQGRSDKPASGIYGLLRTGFHRRRWRQSVPASDAPDPKLRHVRRHQDLSPRSAERLRHFFPRKMTRPPGRAQFDLFPVIADMAFWALETPVGVRDDGRLPFRPVETGSPGRGCSKRITSLAGVPKNFELF